MKKHYEIVFEDDDLIALNKNAGVLSIPDRYNDRIPNLKTLLQRDYGEIFVVHRLDRDTSGLICFAKNSKTHELLSKQFESRTIQKYYHAITHSSPPSDKGDIDLKILIPKNRNKVSINIQGKESLSKYELIEKFLNYSLLEIELITGRKHQIRAHLAHIKLPIVADELYGIEKNWSLSSIKGKKYQTKKWENEKPLIHRQLLHARRMIFTHPISNSPLSIEAPYPKDFKAMLNQLRKLNAIL